MDFRAPLTLSALAEYGDASRLLRSESSHQIPCVFVIACQLKLEVMHVQHIITASLCTAICTAQICVKRLCMVCNAVHLLVVHANIVRARNRN